MKRLALILSLLIAVLAACTRPAQPVPVPEAPQHDTLAAIDTLMQRQPDSALYALLDFNDNHKNLTPFDRRYADLLLSEALFKNDCEQATRPALLDALNYFDSLAAAQQKSEDFFLLSARSHYMNGVGLVEADSVVEACAEYLKALEIMENRFDEKELTGQKAKFMALTYNRLGDLFSDQFMTEQAILCYNESLSLFDGDGSYMTVVYIGLHYEMAGKNDSALYYYDLAMEQLPDTNSLLYRDIVSDKALLYYMAGGYHETALNELKRMMDKAVDEEEKLTRSLTIGSIYFGVKQYDSAIIYLESVFNDTTDYLRQIQTADYLNIIYDNLGEKGKANHYARFLAEHTISEYGKRNVASKFNELLQQYQQKKQEIKLSKTKHSIFQKYAFLTAFLVIIAILILIIIRYSAKKKIASQQKASEKQQREIQEKSQQHIEKERLLHQEEKEELMNEIKERDNDIRAIQQKLQHSKKSNKPYEDFLNEPVCRNILGIVQGIPITTRTNHNDFWNVCLSDDTLSEFFDAVSKHFRDLLPYLRSVSPDITQEDVLICCLYLLGLEDKHISFLRHKDYSTVKRRTNYLQKTFKTSKKFSEYIRKTALEKYLNSKLFG